jgi:uncharacterized membrane protein YccF (DUF307 family)
MNENMDRYFTALEKSSAFVYGSYGLMRFNNVYVQRGSISDYKSIRFVNLGVLDNDFWLLGPADFKKNFKIVSDSCYLLSIYVDVSYRKYANISIL